MSTDRDQRENNDRRYREDVPYLLPKDLGETERLNLQHYIIRYALKGNYATPLNKHLTRILDVGSGSGIWGQEMATEFPEASIFGMDLEPPHQTSSAGEASSSPANYRFVQGNVLQELPFPDGTFDFTHQRMLIGAIPAQNWPRVIQELVRVTRSGGWIELMEGAASYLNAGPALGYLFQWIQEACLARGIDLSKAEEVGAMLAQAGLTQITQQFIDIHFGAWDTSVGVLLERDAIAGFDALKPLICKQIAITPTEFAQQVATVLRECEERHTLFRVYLAYGQVE